MASSLGGRPRRQGVSRRPDGTVARNGRYERGQPKTPLTDEQRAKKTDPRTNYAAGQLELLTSAKGGITRFERLAGEKWAAFLALYRTIIVQSPRPTAAGCNLEPSGKAPERDPFDLSDDYRDLIEFLRERHERVEKIFRDLSFGELVREALTQIFVLDEMPKKSRIKLARKGLQRLIIEFGLQGEVDEATKAEAKAS